VILGNFGANRVQAVVRLDHRRMGFAVDDPDAVRIRHADPKLLQYFTEDPTTIEAPESSALMAAQPDALASTDKEDEEEAFGLEERPEDLPLEERRARDPDGSFSWDDGVLTCPVRPHDYRLFEFSAL
jgi:hypothetical protein